MAVDAMRVFSRIHLALFGLVPWSACPVDARVAHALPCFSRGSIYEFSSWARASIVPLLLLDAVKPVRPVPFALEELFSEPRELRVLEGERIFRFPKAKSRFSLSNVFLKMDRVLKRIERWQWHPGKARAIAKAEAWTR
jgi:squalene-hopene/tetraprenyl-beta-curcumene cyclase